MACLVGMVAVLASSTAVAKLVQKSDALGVTVQNAYGKTVTAQVKLSYYFDDAVAAPKPVLVLNHGRSYKPDVRAQLAPESSYGANARWFARAGFFVVLPTRIGYGATGGDDVEDTGACTKKNYPPGYQLAAQQTLEILQHARQRPGVSPNRAVVVGQSYGGTTSITVAASNPVGVQAVVNFAGGGGGNPETLPQQPCAPQQLQRMFAQYGKTARTPSLWLYSENDMYFGPTYPKEWFDAFVQAGGTGQYHMLPPHGKDGHGSFTSAPGAWRPRVTQFLQSNGFADLKWRDAGPADVAASAGLLNAAFRQGYGASGFADIADAQAVPGLNAYCRQKYTEWLKNPSPRGFAVADDGGCGYSSGTKTTAADLPTDPAERALLVCQRVRNRSCRLYAIDDTVVWAEAANDE